MHIFNFYPFFSGGHTRGTVDYKSRVADWDFPRIAPLDRTSRSM